MRLSPVCIKMNAHFSVGRFTAISLWKRCVGRLFPEGAPAIKIADERALPGSAFELFEEQ